MLHNYIFSNNKKRGTVEEVKVILSEEIGSQYCLSVMDLLLSKEVEG